MIPPLNVQNTFQKIKTIVTSTASVLPSLSGMAWYKTGTHIASNNHLTSDPECIRALQHTNNYHICWILGLLLSPAISNKTFWCFYGMESLLLIDHCLHISRDTITKYILDKSLFHTIPNYKVRHHCPSPVFLTVLQINSLIICVLSLLSIWEMDEGKKIANRGIHKNLIFLQNYKNSGVTFLNAQMTW